MAFDFEAVGPKNMYMMYHEELESLAKFIPELERARFWMTFGDAYINHLTVLKNVGMIGIEPVEFQGQQIVPLQFLAAVLPKPETLGATTKGKTNIGDIATGEALDGSGDKDLLHLQHLRPRRSLCRDRQPGDFATPPACLR